MDFGNSDNLPHLRGLPAQKETRTLVLLAAKRNSRVVILCSLLQVRRRSLVGERCEHLKI